MHKVPFVNYPLQYSLIRREINHKIQGLLSKGDLYLRDDAVKFEKDLALFVGTKFGIVTNSCTDSMFLSLYAKGVGKGDEVITSGHTYVATLAAIALNGAKPILVDVDKDYSIDPDLVEEAVTPRTKAIIPVHLNGRMCNMQKVAKTAREHDLFIVEDAAQALGAKFQGEMAGSFGLTGCFSFYPAKILGCYGDGGFICTDDEKIADKLYLLRDNGEKAKYLARNLEEAQDKKIYCFGFNSVLDNIQAGVLNVKLRYLPSWIKRRREIAKIYDEGLCDAPNTELPPGPESNATYYDVYQNYVIRAKQRDKLQKHLEEKSIETLVSWRTPNHLQPSLHLGHFRLPETEETSKEVISLPMYPELTDEQVHYVIRAVRGFCRKK